MKKVIARWICAVLMVLTAPVFADSPVVATPVSQPITQGLPELPHPVGSHFAGVTRISATSRADFSESVNIRPRSNVSAFGFPCDLDVDVVSLDRAVLLLHVLAPCQPHADVHVSHGGLHFKAKTSITGAAQLKFPAMQTDAKVFVAVGEDVFEHSIEIDEARHFARVALVDVDLGGFDLLVDHPSDNLVVDRYQGLQLVSLDLRQIETEQTYRLILRHEVTDRNCDKPVHSLLRKILPGHREKQQVLKLLAQDCAQVGNILELKNIVPDLKIAAH